MVLERLHSDPNPTIVKLPLSSGTLRNLDRQGVLNHRRDGVYSTLKLTPWLVCSNGENHITSNTLAVTGVPRRGG